MMELVNAVERNPICSERLVPQIGPNHQVTMPPLKQSARIASLEYINRDQWYACGLPVPIMHIAAAAAPSPSPPPSSLRKKSSRSSADQDKSLSLASTSNSRSNHGVQAAEQQKFPCAEAMMGSKDANSCASSSKETCQAWKKEESSSLTLGDAFQAPQQSDETKALAMAVEDLVPGSSGQSELKSSITSVVQGIVVIKKKKKRRSCWQTLKRKGNKKPKIEKGKPYKRWSGSLHSEVAEASVQGSAGAGGGGGWGGRVADEGREGCGRVVPGSPPVSWSEEEVAGFTLALYLFDKDFCAIKRFLETKKMKDILHLYYGKFYGTPAFCRWAGSKNSRNRKCVHGPRILQGWRQDELLRRLLPHFPEACMAVILQAVKSFNERQLSVEGLASELKATVGLETLVHCVGIGVPKRDLTAVHGDPANKHGNHHLAVGGGGGGGGGARGVVESRGAAGAGAGGGGGGAAGKACSSLSKEEMLECLTGSFRISKTRAQDLFWEAVWPRLLGHGWHSTEWEAAAAAGFPGSKSAIAFLRPGVTKIARGSSKKGVHYFDSVSEVLKAVANDPGLLDGDGADGLTGDTVEGSENHEEVEDDEDDEEEEEEEDAQEEAWSDDMFETLDMHRLRVPRTGKMEAAVKIAKAAFKTAAAAVATSSSPSPCPSPSPTPSPSPSSSPTPSPSPSPSPSPLLSEEEHAAQDSSESSSVDIDLNRPLSAISSKSPELPIAEEVEDVKLRSAASVEAVVSHHHQRCPIEGIDLNLPPLDLDCNSPVENVVDHGEDMKFELQSVCPSSEVSSPFTKPVENMEVVQCKTWDPSLVVTHTVMAASIEICSASLMGTINLNDPLPAVDMVMQEAGLNCKEQSRPGEQIQSATGSAGLRSIWPVGVELVPFERFFGDKACNGPQLLNRSAPCTCGFAHACKCQSRKRSLSHPEDEATAARGGCYYGKELISIPKKRAIRFELPFRLNGLHTPNFIFSMHVTTMNSWARLGIHLLPRASKWGPKWIRRVSPSVVPFRVEEESFALSFESKPPKCGVVEVNDDVDSVDTETGAENQASDVQRSLSTQAPPVGQFGNVKRLRCHFSESEPAVSPTYSRSKLHRLPRKYTISFDSRSSKSRLLKAKERCPDWSWPEGGRNSKNVVDTLSCCSTSHAIASADSPERQCASEKSRQEAINPDSFYHGSSCNKGNDYDSRRRSGVGERIWETTAGANGHEDGDTGEIHQAKSLPSDWKVPCLTLTAPADSCDEYGFRRQIARARGIRTHHARSHSQPAKIFDREFLNFGTGRKRVSNDLEELDTTKKTKVDTSLSLGRPEMSEEDVVETLCSMQEQRLEVVKTSSEDCPKLKGTRSSRLRRRNFRTFPYFIFEGHVDDDVEEGFFVQPCTSQGPWQPTLPTTDKIQRSPRLRRRRSGLPCKGSWAVSGATSPVVPVSSGAGNSAKGQAGSRLPGQNMTGEEEVTAACHWPTYDVRYSLRRQLSGGPSRTDRRRGTKVPARWNQHPCC